MEFQPSLFVSQWFIMFKTWDKSNSELKFLQWHAVEVKARFDGQVMKKTQTNNTTLIEDNSPACHILGFPAWPNISVELQTQPLSTGLICSGYRFWDSRRGHMGTCTHLPFKPFQGNAHNHFTRCHWRGDQSHFPLELFPVSVSLANNMAQSAATCRHATSLQSEFSCTTSQTVPRLVR